MSEACFLKFTFPQKFEFFCKLWFETLPFHQGLLHFAYLAYRESKQIRSKFFPITRSFQRKNVSHFILTCFNVKILKIGQELTGLQFLWKILHFCEKFDAIAIESTKFVLAIKFFLNFNLKFFVNVWVIICNFFGKIFETSLSLNFVLNQESKTSYLQTFFSHLKF